MLKFLSSNWIGVPLLIANLALGNWLVAAGIAAVLMLCEVA